MIGETTSYGSVSHSYTVTAVSSDTTLGTVSGGGATSGTATVVATAIGIGEFVNWTVAGIEVSTSPSFTFRPTDNITIQANFIATIALVTWANGTAAQLKDMIDAHYDGKIDLRDYWSLGDTRTVTLPAMTSQSSQSVQLVLMDSTCTGFTLTTEQVTPAFIVGQKNCLSATDNMSGWKSNVNGWYGSGMKGWCNDSYKTAMDSVMPNIFKQFTWKTGRGNGYSSGLVSSDDYFALPPAKAVLGSYATDSFGDEALLYNQWNWYTTASNIIKTVAGSDASWWMASPAVYTNDSFCYIYKSGFGATAYPTASMGIAPFGCI